MASTSSHTLSWEANMAMRKRRTLRKGMASGFNGGCHYVINQTALVARGELNVVFRPVWLSASGVSRCEPWGNQWRQFSRKANCGIPLHPLCLMPIMAPLQHFKNDLELPRYCLARPLWSPLSKTLEELKGRGGFGGLTKTQLCIWLGLINQQHMHLLYCLSN